ncbi:NTP transferase domain-containing protein [Microbacterium esteraromaticum]|uniref:NTP transferase domain-containing protein n=1 Tax=Microbacterium esteraromaticum TaxID=57043 RepID=UPI0019D32878|nr:NTP transferase domain-containing protein [Microbacterium esteraromaticum]MBN7794141.1 nucleotidyltransferase family protein [Microbacterium esteraromaticum]
MRYVIMANGHGTRWGGHNGIPKHLIEFDGETLLRRIVRQVAEADPGADIVISASNPRYETEGARRHAPEVNEIELDRFVPELIVDEVTFLYGDTLYSTSAIAAIVAEPTTAIDFFGDERAIVAVKSVDRDLLLRHLDRVRRLFIANEIDACKGWQVYQSYEGLSFDDVVLGPRFRILDDATVGFNTPEEHTSFTDWLRQERQHDYQP